jgi:Domain of unknown function (DUF4262)
VRDAESVAAAVTCVALVLAFAFALAASSSAAASSEYGRVQGEVRKSGWSCVQVKADRPEHAFAYSVGLTSKHLPELGLFGTDDPAVACAAIGRVARVLIAAGRAPRNGAEMFRSADGRVVLRAVLRNEFFDRCALAKRWRDEHHIASARAMQILVLDPGEPMPR